MMSDKRIEEIKERIKNDARLLRLAERFNLGGPFPTIEWQLHAISDLLHEVEEQRALLASCPVPPRVPVAPTETILAELEKDREDR